MDRDVAHSYPELMPKLSLDKTQTLRSHYIEILSGREDSRERSGYLSEEGNVEKREKVDSRLQGRTLG